MDKSNSVHDHHTYHRKTIPGREFKVCFSIFGLTFFVPFKIAKLIDAVRLSLSLWSIVSWVEILDYEGNILLGRKRLAHLCHIARNHRGNFEVFGPTINPTFIEAYVSNDLLSAIDFALDWIDNSWDNPYWVKIAKSNSKMVLPSHCIEKMYHANVRASGGSIHTCVIDTSGVILTPLEKIV
ncbi:hypothetical protein ACFL0K_00655 [Patescibacteria group bacterium]